VLLPLLLNLETSELVYSYGVQAAGESLEYGVQAVGTAYEYDRLGQMAA
jgi:hypothetical protein